MMILVNRGHVSLCVRCTPILVCLVEVNYSPDLFSLVHVLQNVYTLIPFLVNSALMWRMRRGLSVPVSVFLLLSLMDLFLIFTSISFSGGAVSPYYLLLLPTMAIFAIVFTSLRLVTLWALLLSGVYTFLWYYIPSGVGFSGGSRPSLGTRLATMLCIAVQVYLVCSFDRQRLRRVLFEQRALLAEPVEASVSVNRQAIH